MTNDPKNHRGEACGAKLRGRQEGKTCANAPAEGAKYQAAREREAQQQFQLSEVHYWQEVNRLADHPAARAWDPHTVNLLARRRISRDQLALPSRFR